MLADLGAAELACPHERILSPSDTSLPSCTLEYRAPVVFLGNKRFGADLDLWSLGCVAADLFLREPLFQPKGQDRQERSVLVRIMHFWGHPRETPARMGG